MKLITSIHIEEAKRHLTRAVKALEMERFRKGEPCVDPEKLQIVMVRVQQIITELGGK